MIETAEKFVDGSVLDTDVCIVGGGAAGIAMAYRFIGKKRDVLLLESGGASESAVAKDLNRGEVVDPSLHSPTHLYRHRVFGGTTSTWGGRCVPFDPIDFEPRDWIPASGWPITYDEVARYYPDAMTFLEAGECIFSANEALSGGMKQMVRSFAPVGFDLESIERFSCPTNLGHRYRRLLNEASNVRVLLDATCTEIITTEDGRRVDHLLVRTTSGSRTSLRIRAGCIVLATGGIETPRLLLTSHRHAPNGIGNDRDNVGRYYMCHIAGITGEVQFNCDPENIFHDYERSWDGVYCRRRIRLRTEFQRKLQVGNIVLRLHHPRLPDPAHGRGILSMIYLAKPFISKEYSHRLHGSDDVTIGLLGRHIRNVLLESPTTLAFLLDWARRRTFAARKLPSLVVRPRNNAYSLDIHSEQAPNASSRITLSECCDRFGMPRVKVDWQYLPLDIKTVQVALYALAGELQTSGLGTLTFAPERVAYDMVRDGAFGGHHIGTTRMAESARDGVVDRNCRVFGVDNLYIASSSVFPTSGQANPTLTIVAIALRLSDHLLERAK